MSLYVEKICEINIHFGEKVFHSTLMFLSKKKLKKKKKRFFTTSATNYFTKMFISLSKRVSFYAPKCKDSFILITSRYVKLKAARLIQNTPSRLASKYLETYVY